MRERAETFFLFSLSCAIILWSLIAAGIVLSLFFRGFT